MSEQQSWPIDKIERGSQPDTYNVWLKGDFGFSTFDAEQLAAAGITPPPDPINFDTMPVGSVVASCNDVLWVRANQGWTDGIAECGGHPPEVWAPYTVVHVPDAPSVRTALHTIGLTDQDIETASFVTAGPRWAREVARAARAAENER